MDITGTITDGSLLLAVPLAALGGLVAVASPCVLPLVPGFLAYASGLSAAQAYDDAPRRRGRLLLAAALFLAGFTVVFVSAGVLLSPLGSFLLENQDRLERVLGGVTVVLGLAFIGLPPWRRGGLRLDRRPAVAMAGAPVLGVLVGLGWSPCVGPALAAVMSLGVDPGTAARGGVLAVAYVVGLGAPFLLAALGLSRAVTVLGRVRRHHLAFMRVGGAVLVLVAALLASGGWDAMVTYLQVWGNGFTPEV